MSYPDRITRRSLLITAATAVCALMIAAGSAATPGPPAAGLAEVALLPQKRSAASRVSAAKIEIWRRRSLRIASSYWEERRPAQSCGSAVELTLVRRLPRDFWGMAPIGGCLDALASGSPTWIEMTRAPFRAGWLSLCALMVHEYGHLTGLRHNKRPHSIMYPRVSYKNLPRECVRQRER